jgi:hypothetical protein
VAVGPRSAAHRRAVRVAARRARRLTQHLVPDIRGSEPSDAV